MNQLNQDLDDDLLALLLADDASAAQVIGVACAEGPTPLSFAQQRLWFLQQFAPQSSAYNLPRALRIEGRLDPDLLEAALNAVIDRHDILRTRFFEVDGQPCQQVDRQARLRLGRHDLRTVPEDTRDQALRQRLDADIGQPFDLTRAPLIRATLLQLGDDLHVLQLNMHHIVSDAWSNAILVQDLMEAFAALAEGSNATLPRPPIQYADYAHWQREQYPDSAAHDQAAHYWRQALDGEIPTLDLPLDHPRQPDQGHPVANHHLTLPADLVRAMQRHSQAQGLTPFIVLLGAWQLLLSRYSGQQDFTVGVPNATRNQGQTQELVGFFVSSQVYRARVDSRQTTADFLQDLRAQSLAALEHADYPLELILEELALQRSSQTNPLFQTLFNWRVAGQAGEALRLGGLEVEFLELEQQEAKFDLSLEVDYSQQQVEVTFSYSSALFEAATIERMGRHWQTLLEGLVNGAPDLHLGELGMLRQEERQRYVQGWNDTRVSFADNDSVHGLFERQVRSTPDAIAVRLDEQTLDYRSLNHQANHLALQLVARGIGADSLVGIACERSLEMIVALLAVLKAGGAYVPLDPAYPQDRLAYMIEDSGITLLLTQASVYEHLTPIRHVETLLLENALDLTATPDAVDLRSVVDADHLAYVIYTSGSTGRPKGVQVRHGALSNHMLWMQQVLQLHAGDRVLQKTAFSFDASVWEFWMPLLNGAELVLASPALSDDLSLLWPQVQAYRITVLQAAPSLIQALMPQASREQLASLRAIMLGGEALAPALVTQLRQHSEAQLYNLYGPSEATIDTTCHWIENAGDSAVVAIGRPISNVHVHVLDHDLQPCPPGVNGELLIGGASLARGYHQRPGLTAERFVPDPLGTPGARLYRSGDLTRRRVDGVVDYVGRIDHQVKLHGLRIELGEIEACLLLHPEVAEAVVLAPTFLGSQRLVAYVVPCNGVDAKTDLLAPLREQLPAYMIPAHLVLLERLPLTSNGKLDRRALPLPDAPAQRHVAPQGALECAIADIWQSVLKQPLVGRTDNFFELGGDSIVSIQVVSRARQAGIRFTPKDLFQHQTVQALALIARHEVADPGVSIDQAPASGEVALLPIQQTFFETPMPQRHHWNQSVLLKPAGEPLLVSTLEQALNALLDHHDALRLSFTQKDTGWTSHYRAPGLTHTVLQQLEAADDDGLERACEQAQRSLDLTDGPLLRALLVQLADGRQRLLLAAHHLVIDGVSWRILFEDLQSAYQQAARGQTPRLPARTSSLQQFAEALRAHAQAPHSLAELSYWLHQHEGIAHDLPHTGAEPSMPARMQHLETHLDAEQTRRLLQQAPAAYRTQVNDLLLTALARVLARWTGHDANLIQLESHGREELHEGLDLTRTVGWFTSVYPLRLTTADDLPSTLKQVKEQLRGVPNKGIGYGALRYLGDAATRAALQDLPEAHVTFNYLGQFDNSFDRDRQPLLIPADEAAGAEKDIDAPPGNWLSINGKVYGGELGLSWSFDEQRFEPAVIERLAQDYQVELQALIEHCCTSGNQGVTPSDFPLAGLDQAGLDALPITLAQVEDLYPLSPLQQGMLFHTLYEQDGEPQAGRSYLNQMRLDVTGLDPQVFADAWQAALDSHAILRTCFLWQGAGSLERPLQAVLRQMSVPFSLLDWQHQPDLAFSLEKLAHDELQREWALDQAPLFRLVLVQTGPRQYHLIHTSHHILMDGWSTSQLLGEVLQRYSGQSVALAAGRYRDYIAWLGRQDGVADQAFWQGQLAGLDEPTRLAQAIPHDVQGEGHGSQYLRLAAAPTARLNAFARRQRVTLNTLVQAAWVVLLQRYSGQAGVCFGATVAGRPAEVPGIEQQVGLFINTLPVIANPRPDQTVGDWLQHLQAHNVTLREHEHTALGDIQRWAGKPGEALFDNLLVFENYPVSEALEQEAPAGLEFGQVDYHEQTNYPMTLAVSAGTELVLHASHARAHIGDAPARQMMQHLLNLLEAMSQDATRALGELEMLDAEEFDTQLLAWNDTAVDYPLDAGVHQLIEAQVERTPSAPALVFGEQALDYAALNAQANQLAHRLIAQGVGPDVLVGIAIERSVEMVVGLLAILKAGGAYVPVDPDYPAERLSYMLEDSGIALLLSQSHLQLPVADSVQRLDLDTLDVSTQPTHNPGIVLHPENLAYVIYTSGSTGKPKGAGNRHSALTNRLCWMQQAYALDAGDTVLQKTPFSFDVSVWEFFWPLMTGARLAVAAPGDHREPAKLVEAINRHQVSTLHFVPSMLQAFLLDEAVASCTSLTRIVCSGEALPVDAQQQVFAKLPNAGLYNLYGPTEAAIDVTHWTCRDEGRDAVPIGQPIANLQTYVLDSELQPVPVGVIGELYLAGAGLARGYHRRPALTAERFVTSPFGEGERLYRTGDLASQRADGVIEYRGRIDHQVKLRGLRIELGEIEARLLALESVREAVVLAVPLGDSLQLAGYLVPVDQTLLQASAEEQQAWRQNVRHHLLQALPDYMVPMHLPLLDRLPLSPNGKLDRKALPTLDSGATPGARVAPVTDVEQRLAAIWQAVLKLDQVGITDNFFELGGDSIISIQVVSRARQAGIQFTPKALFEQQTIQRLAHVVRLQADGPVFDQSTLHGPVPLLPIQQHFFAQPMPERHHWNQAVLLRANQPLQVEALTQALQALVLHHDALRLSFSEHADGWQADIRDLDAQHTAWAQAPLLWHEHVKDETDLQALFDRAQASLDLQQGLVRAVLAELPDASQRLLLVIHHLVVDGVSWRMLFEDLQTAYPQALANQPCRLASKTSSVRAWAERLQAAAREGVLRQESAWWLDNLQGLTGDLPRDRAVDRLPNHQARSVHVSLDSQRTRQLLQQAPAAYRTQVNDLLLSALSRVMTRWSGQPDLLLQLEGHGREALFDDLDLTRTVGWFTSLFPVRLTPAEGLAATLKQVKEQLRAIPHKGLGFGALRYLGDSETRRALAALPVPRLTFNYLGQLDAGFDNEQATLFTPAEEGTGAAQSAQGQQGNWLTVNGQVFAGELGMTFGFNADMYDEQTIKTLAEAYLVELTALVEHCLDPAHHGLTPSDVPLAHLDQAALDSLPVSVADIDTLYPLAPMQQGMLFHTLYQQEAGNYVNQMRLDVSGLDPERFRAAWQATLDAHDVLRSGFIWQGQLDEPLQVVHRQVEMPFSLLDWSDHDSGELVSALDTLAEQALSTPFDLARPPLLRLVMVRTGVDSHHLVYTHHHILMDGWSNSQMMGEIMQRYAGQAVPQAVGRYGDYIAWLQAQDARRGEAFWRNALCDLAEPTRLADALDLGHPEQQGHGLHEVALDATQTAQLDAFAREQKVTINTLVQAVWAILLHRCTGQQTVCFGATVSGRPAELSGIEHQLGLFINTLPAAFTPRPELRIQDWLQQVQGLSVDSREHEHTPLFDIQRWAGSPGTALFDTVMVFENYPVSEVLSRSAEETLSFGRINSHEQINYPLGVMVSIGSQLNLQLRYSRQSFDTVTIQRLAGHVFSLLLDMVSHPSKHIGELTMVHAEQACKLMAAPAATAAGLRPFQSVTQLFEAQIARSAHRPALRFMGQTLDYTELNRRANELAHRLIESGVGPDVLVGLATERSVEMIVALLAVLKAGGAYVPLDPEYPSDRLRYMIEDSGIRLLLTQTHLQAKWQLTSAVSIIPIDQPSEVSYSSENPDIAHHAHGLAYVIYTSGSTGKPKGVMISHQALTNFVTSMSRAPGIGENDRVLSLTTFSFDIFGLEIYAPLSNGGSITLVPQGMNLDPGALLRLAATDDVTVLQATPSTWRMLLEHPDAHLLAGRKFFCGGEALAEELAGRMLQLSPNVWNLYGPTETTIWSAVHVLDTYHPKPWLGGPIDNTSLTILDSGLEALPLGTPGELLIGGLGLARGYYQRPALTAERFLPDPSGAQPGGRVYRSGDLARRRMDGVIEYLGRLDHQVKIRGLRIELGEIEARVMQMEGVREAAVIAQATSSGDQLAGYLVGDDTLTRMDETSLSEALRAWLKMGLPDYMVPSRWMLVEQMPLTPNGKLDRKALPTFQAIQTARTYEPPKTDFEKQMAAVWEEVLQVEHVGLNDNFFELGGHSLLAIRLMARIQLMLGQQLSAHLLFDAPTLSALVDALQQSGQQIDDNKLSKLETLFDELEEV
ncbi:non-ribosomal peptide synthase/polyketide synthase [Pseudomonas alabamensis]|uniref:non-ribosomal peptide synthase/polyketide synthase n=1 Tax=Pseudomonas alabamensis TaxID=3064349 RepID=UPI003F64E787